MIESSPIKQNGSDQVFIDVAHLNCFEEPYVFQIGEQKILLRFKCSARTGDYCKIKLEKVLP